MKRHFKDKDYKEEKEEKKQKERKEPAFSREELWALYDRISQLEKATTNENWKRVYSDLGHAISTLDAFIARTELKTCECNSADVH